MKMISADGKIKLVVKRNPDWDEWVVKHYDLNWTNLSKI